MEKETLEKAAEKYINDDLDLYESLVDGHISYNIGIDLLNKLFTAGAKWQAERIYSRQDLIEFVYFLNDRHFNKYMVDTDEVDLFIEEFKKK